MRKFIDIKKALISLLGSFIMAFGLYNIHSVSNVTEGGVLGGVLLIEYWLNISPAVTSFVLNAACYIFGWRVLGRDFVKYSIAAGVGFSAFYAILEQFPRVYPPIADMPLIAALVGAVFIGVGAGLCVRVTAAPSGDDALAMAVSKLTGCRVQNVYLITDIVVLALSLSYIPVRRIAYSLLSVIISGQLVGLLQPKKQDNKEK